MDEEQAVDVHRMAEILAVSDSTIRRLAADREIPSFRIGNRLRFWPSEVRAAIAQRDPWARSNQARAKLVTHARKRLRQGVGTAHDAELVRRYAH